MSKSTIDLNICPKCNTSVLPTDKFCSACGQLLQESDKPLIPEYSIPQIGIAIEFPESSSCNFTDAVRYTLTAPIHANTKKGKKYWYMAAWPHDEIQHAIELVRKLSGFRNRKVWIDGKEYDWWHIFQFTWCYNERNHSFRPTEYCFGINNNKFNLWGCLQTRLGWDNQSLFHYGNYKYSDSFKEGHIFVFDKERMRHELQNQLYEYRYCPYINFKLVDAVLTVFPNEVKVRKKRGDWRYSLSSEEQEHSLKFIEEWGDYTQEYYSSGVEPRGPEVGMKILKRALQSMGMSTEVIGISSSPKKFR